MENIVEPFAMHVPSLHQIIRDTKNKLCFKTVLTRLGAFVLNDAVFSSMV